MLRNGNFSGGWETLPAIEMAGFLRNQRPHDWEVSWLEVGQPLYDDLHTAAKGIPECVHKLTDQLPPDERLGGAKALILDGDAVYKIFNSGAAFGAALSQVVTGLAPGSTAVLTVPIQAHLHGDSDPYGAESGVWVNGVGAWVNGLEMGDRKWYEHKIEFIVPDNGQAEIVIRVKSKWDSPKDFFFDGVTLVAQTDPTPPPPNPDPPSGGQTVFVQLPDGFQLQQGVCSQANVIEVNAPAGVTIQVV
jgi:hypothetical protein